MNTTTQSLPALDREYSITDEQIAYFQNNGHILLREVCPYEDIGAFTDLFRNAVAERAQNLKPLAERDTYGKAFVQIMNLWRDDPRYKHFVFAKRFAQVAARLLGCKAVRLYHDQALYKEPGGGLTPWHQDQTYWPLDTDNTVTMWMPLVDISESMGTMSFGSGSHKHGYLGDSHIESDDDNKWLTILKDKGCAVVNHGAMKAGDATFHAGLVLHGAPGNSSDRAREVMTVIYYPDGTKVLTPDNAYRRCDLEAWIPGGEPGEPAASELNPVLYSGA